MAEGRGGGGWDAWTFCVGGVGRWWCREVVVVVFGWVGGEVMVVVVVERMTCWLLGCGRGGGVVRLSVNQSHLREYVCVCVCV